MKKNSLWLMQWLKGAMRRKCRSARRGRRLLGCSWKDSKTGPSFQYLDGLGQIPRTALADKRTAPGHVPAIRWDVMVQRVPVHRERLEQIDA